MSRPPTLFELAGAVSEPPSIGNSIVILVDYQNEYLEGPLALPNVVEAVKNAVRLLEAARHHGAPVVHVVHKGAKGSLFDREARRGAVIAELTPMSGEVVIEKAKPNAFHGTDLAERIAASGRKLIVAGLMTHMCVSSTCRAALDLGIPVTLVHDACATRPLPKTEGGVVDANELHIAEIAALADRFVTLAKTADLF
jgi:nicotinamidase-related amidase